MYQQPQDHPAAPRLPGAGEPPGARPGPTVTGRARGLRQVRRWSNWTAAALIAATVVTTGYFARASLPTTATTAGAGVAAGQPGTAVGTHQPCVSVPVATSGGSGVTRQTVVRSCGTGTSAPVVITTGRTHEGGDS
jgi:hypothetical protein